MAKLALALLAAPAAAFNFGGGGGAPARAASTTTADIGVDPGPIEPTGPFWEDQEGLARRRAVEIKHGRIAMMAFIGMIVEELGVTFPAPSTSTARCSSRTSSRTAWASRPSRTSPSSASTSA